MFRVLCLGCALVVVVVAGGCGGGFGDDSRAADPLREWLVKDSVTSAKAEAAVFVRD